MTEEKKERPDWLSDFQNNQETSGKQTSCEVENNQISLDIYSPLVTNISPRYGRRSVTGAKSVENSPKKQHSQEHISFTPRSNSARPALLNKIGSTKESINENKVDLNAENFVSSLQVLQNDLENFSLSEFNGIFGKVSNSDIENVFNPTEYYENLEDSWNSLNIFNIKQKGRLGSTEKNVSTKQENYQFSKDTFQRQFINENIVEEDKTYNIAINKNLDAAKSKLIKETVEGSRKERDIGTVNKINSKNIIKDFIIPELPQGKTLVFNIKTTWGDKHYLGLNGIEIFNSKGKKVKVKSITAKPSDINILPEYSKDPRVVENLIDNIYLTQDDMHMWLAPFTINSSHLIFIEFYEIEELAMLRIWNYNKSRIHCSRGAKDVEIRLDSSLIFIGEIAIASGEILNSLNCLGDTILFTTDEDILEMVAENDEYFNYNSSNHLEENQTSQEELRPLTGADKEKLGRPFTGPKNNTGINNAFYTSTQYKIKKKNIPSKYFNDGDSLDPLEELNTELKQFNLNVEFTDPGKSSEVIERTQNYLIEKLIPKKLSIDTKNKEVASVEQRSEEQNCTLLPGGSSDTYEIKENEHIENDLIAEKSGFLDKSYTLYIPSASFLASDSVYETLSMPTGYNFTIQIHSTWGDSYYVGLNGIQIFNENNEEIKIYSYNISADPESVNVLDGIDNDARTPDKLIDGINDSIDGCHMWLAPVLPLTINRIYLMFQNPVTLSSLKLWNYAKTPSRGVREFGVLVDGLLIYNGELDQATIPADGCLPNVPCKTVNFSNPSRVQSNINFLIQKEETSSGTQHPADQSRRPLTTMTNHS